MSKDSKTSDKVAQIGAGLEKDKSGTHTKKWKAPLWKLGSKVRRGVWRQTPRNRYICAQSSLRADIRVKLNLAQDNGKLDLSECELESIPEEVFDIECLTELSLAGNNLSSIPRGIGRLRNLEKLQLSGNRLREVPDELCLLDNLEGLWLHGNLLEHLPSDIGALPHLKQLAIAGNRLTSLPESIGLLSALSELVVAGNRLEELPKSIGTLSSLRNLDLHGNQLGSVCDTVGMLSSLEELWLQGNKKLEGLPPTLKGLHQLKKMSAADCSLTQIPSELGEMQELQDLSLYGNKLERVPVDILQAPRLRKVWLEGNPLHSENVRDLVHAANRKICFHIGLDDVQVAIEDDRVADNDMKNVLSSRIFSNCVSESMDGYWKLDRHVGGHSSVANASPVLVVAFGSAPGVPNWGGAIRRVRENFDNDSHAEINFDVLYVVDPHRSWYGGGDERYSQYNNAIEKIASQYPKVIFIGDSMGATAALMFAKHATMVHSFCPQIDLSKSSIRPGEEEAWEGILKERVLAGIEACSGDIQVHVGNWHHDVQQSNIIPSSLEQARVKIYGIDSHRLAIALDRGNKLIPILESSILQCCGVTNTANIRLSNFF
eukprot:jgi/Picre1/30496/NNA_005860.t1